MAPTLGQQLRRARERQYLTLADLAHETRIPVSRLRDLENDEYTAFGGVAYVRMFLRTYASRLEVDADEALAKLAPSKAFKSKARLYFLRRTAPWILPSIFNRSRRQSKPDVARDPLGRELKAMAIVCAITLLLGASYLVAQAYQKRHEEVIPPTRPIPQANINPVAAQVAEFEVSRAVLGGPAAAPPADPPRAIPVSPTLPVVKAELVK